jgi:acetyl/propionyl-CoA carboxylase alpha subunit
VLDPRSGAAQAADLGYVVGCTSGDARGGGGLGERPVTELERKHLAETDRRIAECEAYITKQRELIERAIQQGRSTEVAEATIEALEASLRTFERQRQRLLDRLKGRE